MRRAHWLCIFWILWTVVLCSACTPKGHPLPDGMEEAKVLEHGWSVVEQLNQGAYPAIYQSMRSDAQSLSSEEQLRTSIQPILEKAGPLKQQETALATGQTLKETQENYATAVFYCKHQEDNVMYRIAFDTSYLLIGLEVRRQ